MPIYEYLCEDCSHKFEKLQKISDDPLSECPECGEASLRKLISAAAFRLSGSGWYETDFKDKKQQKNLSSSDSKKPESTESGKSADSKQAASGDSGKKTAEKKSGESKKSSKASSDD